MAAIDTSANVKNKNHEMHTESFVMSITGNIGDTAKLLTARPGMVIDDIQVSNSALASGTYTVGDSVQAARYISSTSTTSAAVTRLNVPTTISSGLVVMGAGYRYTGTTPDEIRLTIGAGANFTNTVIFVRISYHFEGMVS